MKPPPSRPLPPDSEVEDLDAEVFLTLDEVVADENVPADETLETALDDDEGGADPIDPGTGLPYDEDDSGRAGRSAAQQHAAPE